MGPLGSTKLFVGLAASLLLLSGQLSLHLPRKLPRGLAEEVAAPRRQAGEAGTPKELGPKMSHGGAHNEPWWLLLLLLLLLLLRLLVVVTSISIPLL